MTLVVEDGTAKTDAESYISVADADAYFLKRANADWAAAITSDKEASLRKATDYMLQVYRDDWKGWRVSVHQSTDWPRYGVQLTDTYSGMIGFYQIAFNIVPQEVANACAELAVRALSADLLADIQPLPAREKVGPIEIDWVGRTGMYPGGQRTVRYPSIDLMLEPYIDDPGGVPVRRS